MQNSDGHPIPGRALFLAAAVILNCRTTALQSGRGHTEMQLIERAAPDLQCPLGEMVVTRLPNQPGEMGRWTVEGCGRRATYYRSDEANWWRRHDSAESGIERAGPIEIAR